MATPDISHLPSTRKEAKLFNSKYYYTGKICSKNHLSHRYTKSGICVYCRIERNFKNKKYFTEYSRKNKEKINAYGKIYREINKDTISQKGKIYYLNNKEKILLKNKRNYQKSRHKVLQNQTKYRKENKEKIELKRRNRRAKEYGSLGRHTAQEVKALLEVQNYKCANCKCCIKEKSSRHLDHVMPIALGGSNSIDNLEWLCVLCNLRKGAKHPIDWARENGRLIS